MKVTIIVPVYNTDRKYFDKCVESLTSQTHKDLEILFIDDGSKEACASHLDQLAEEIPYARVIHQKNGGISVAKNTGIRNASGNYYTFVDADDYIAGNYIESLLATATESGADIVCGNVILISEKNGREVFREANSREFTASMEGENGHKILKQFYNKIASEISSSQDNTTYTTKDFYASMKSCGKFFRTDIHRDSLFQEGIFFHEDSIFTARALVNSHVIAFNTEAKYYYYVNEQSLTHQPNKFDEAEYTRYFGALYDSLKKYPDTFYGKYVQTMYGILKTNFGKTVKRIKNFWNMKEIKSYSSMLTMEGCANKQEERVRYCLIHNKPFRMWCVIRLANLKEKIKNN